MAALKHLILVLLVTTTSQLFAERAADSTVNRNIIKITPVELIGLATPSFEIGYERFLSSKWSVQATVACFFSNNYFYYSNGIDPQIFGGKIGLEGKYYLKNHNGAYLGIEAYYTSSKNSDYWEFTDANSENENYSYYGSNPWYTDTFTILRQTYNLNVKLGVQQTYKRLSIDMYSGLGARYREVKHFDKTNPDSVMQSTRHLNFFYIFNKDGSYWTVNIPINIKIGVHF